MNFGIFQCVLRGLGRRRWARNFRRALETGIRKMIIFCEECGERYVIEAEELKGAAMIFICRNCNDIIRIPAQRPQQDREEEAPTEAKEA